VVVLVVVGIAAATPAVHSAFTAKATPGRSTFAAAPAFAPRALTPPAISGATTVGATLTTTTGSWARTPATFTYRWLRCQPTCTAIPNEDQAKYTVTGDDAGATLVAEVKAINSGGATTATSPPTTTITRGTYIHILCADPATGAPVGSGGVLPDGLTYGANSTAVPDPSPSVRCDTRAPLIPLTAASTGFPKAGDAGWLDYGAPAGIDVLGGELYRQGSVGGGWAWSISGTESCGGVCTQRGEPTDRFTATNRVTTAGAWRVTLACEPASCDPNADHVVRLFGARITLRDPATPRLTTPATGSLVTDATLSGTESITFSATDTGAGLYKLRASIDNTPVATATLGGCTEEESAYTFGLRRPCAPSVTARTVTFDTAAWPKVGRLRIHLEDAGHNTTTILNRLLG
jgi:hypothetical protein